MVKDETSNEVRSIRGEGEGCEWMGSGSVVREGVRSLDEETWGEEPRRRRSDEEGGELIRVEDVDGSSEFRRVEGEEGFESESRTKEVLELRSKTIRWLRMSLTLRYPIRRRDRSLRLPCSIDEVQEC